MKMFNETDLKHYSTKPGDFEAVKGFDRDEANKMSERAHVKFREEMGRDKFHKEHIIAKKPSTASWSLRLGHRIEANRAKKKGEIPVINFYLVDLAVNLCVYVGWELYDEVRLWNGPKPSFGRWRLDGAIWKNRDTYPY